MTFRKPSYHTTSIIEEIALETHKETDEIKEIIEMFIDKIRKHSVHETVFINKLGTFRTYIKRRFGYGGGLKKAVGSNGFEKEMASKYIVETFENDRFISEKPKVEFTPARTYCNLIMENRDIINVVKGKNEK